MKEYENKSLRRPGADLRDSGRISVKQGKCESGDRTAQSIEHRKGNPRVPGKAVHFSHLVTLLTL